MRRYKVAIIGGGPGGYVTAIRLQQYGIETVVFEKERLGGVCLNRGCIPTKSLVKVAELFSEIKNSDEFGISVGDVNLDYKKVWERKNHVVEKLVSGIEFMFNKRKIPLILKEVNKIKSIDGKYYISLDEDEFEFDYVIIATGSAPKELPSIKIDGKDVLSSKDILEITELPKSLVVVGGGVVGCEFASIFSQFGVKVDIVEFLPNLVFNEDLEISKRLAMSLKKAKIKIHLKTGMESYEKQGENLIVKLSNGKEIETEKILLSVGRKPVCNLTFDTELAKNNDFINIDDSFRTNLPNVFAIGDVTGKLMLAHTASKQGLIVADIINNHNTETFKLSYDNIPKCTFTNVEIGSVGLTEEKAKEKYSEILVGKFPFSANGKALGSGHTFGFVKVIADKETKKLVGVHIIGPHATELIAQCVVLLQTESTIEDVSQIVFAHPTLSETVMEAIEDLEKLAIHKL
ncbi:MAG: dihydrolipoyl dehydrogenase [Candidatus Cloacimonetes bacterium]|nr:dihydrolipoyl dehydrogenase [Candidatus Cloacimonadota bacterium]